MHGRYITSVLQKKYEAHNVALRFLWIMLAGFMMFYQQTDTKDFVKVWGHERPYFKPKRGLLITDKCHDPCCVVGPGTYGACRATKMNLQKDMIDDKRHYHYESSNGQKAVLRVQDHFLTRTARRIGRQWQSFRLRQRYWQHRQPFLRHRPNHPPRSCGNPSPQSRYELL